VIFVIVAVIFFVGVVEGGVRAGYWLAGQKPFFDPVPWVKPDRELLYIYKPNYWGKIYDIKTGLNRLGLRGDGYDPQKPAGGRRIVCLGDSRTFGYHVTTPQAYPVQLERLWNARHSKTPIQTVNAGLHGYSSYQGLRFLETRCTGLDPDLVTVSYGFNDRRLVVRKELADGPEHFALHARRARRQRLLRCSYTALWIRNRLGLPRPGPSWVTQVAQRPSQRLDDLPVRVELADYEKNLHTIAARCRAQNLPCVFIAMDDSPLLNQALDEGRRLREEKRYDEAVEAFRRARKYPAPLTLRQWSRAMVDYEIGLTLEAQGRAEDAAELFRTSAKAAAELESSQGGLTIRDSRPYAEATRRVAAAEDIPLVDITARFADQPELFVDFCHYTPEAHQRIAEAIVECLESMEQPR
jgi:lysophospholipase L1-like esterase